MKTLKEELQEIVDMKKLGWGRAYVKLHICNCLSKENRLLFLDFFEMSKKYAPKYHTSCIDYYTGWWEVGDSENWDYIIKNKYRFIKDLIAIL